MSTTAITLTFSVLPAVAARAGLDQYGAIAVVVRPSGLSEHGRDVLAYLLGKQPIQPESTQRQLGSATSTYSLVTVPPAPLPLTTEAVEAWIEALAAARAAKVDALAVESEARILAALAAADEDWVVMATTGPCYMLRADSDEYSADGGRAYYQPKLGMRLGLYLTDEELNDPRVVARRDQVRTGALVCAQAEWQRRYDEFVTWKAALTQAERDRQLAAAKARQDQIDAFLARAPEALRKRAARGLLPEAELLAAMRDEAFAALAELPRYERLRDAYVRRELDADDDAEVLYDVDDADSASDADLALIERIEAALPDAAVTLRVHTGSIDGCDETVTRYSVRVVRRVGEFEFSREYAADSRSV